MCLKMDQAMISDESLHQQKEVTVSYSAEKRNTNLRMLRI